MSTHPYRLSEEFIPMSATTRRVNRKCNRCRRDVVIHSGINAPTPPKPYTCGRCRRPGDDLNV